MAQHEVMGRMRPVRAHSMDSGAAGVQRRRERERARGDAS
jgi:hypothetical protein